MATVTTARKSSTPRNVARLALSTLRPTPTIAAATGLTAAQRVAHVTRHQPAAVRLFGLDTLAAAAPPVHLTDGCRWCLAKASAKVHGRGFPFPGVWSDRARAEAFTLLLGEPCRTCRRRHLRSTP